MLAAVVCLLFVSGCYPISARHAAVLAMLSCLLWLCLVPLCCACCVVSPCYAVSHCFAISACHAHCAHHAAMVAASLWFLSVSVCHVNSAHYAAVLGAVSTPLAPVLAAVVLAMLPCFLM